MVDRRSARTSRRLDRARQMEREKLRLKFATKTIIKWTIKAAGDSWGVSCKTNIWTERLIFTGSQKPGTERAAAEQEAPGHESTTPRPGDLIAKVNDIDIRDMKPEEAVKVIQDAINNQPQTDIELERVHPLPVVVVIQKPMGLTITTVGPANQKGGANVTKINPGGNAEKWNLLADADNQLGLEMHVLAIGTAGPSDDPADLLTKAKNAYGFEDVQHELFSVVHKKCQTSRANDGAVGGPEFIALMVENPKAKAILQEQALAAEASARQEKDMADAMLAIAEEKAKLENETALLAMAQAEERAAKAQREREEAEAEERAAAARREKETREAEEAAEAARRAQEAAERAEKDSARERQEADEAAAELKRAQEQQEREAREAEQAQKDMEAAEAAARAAASADADRRAQLEREAQEARERYEQEQREAEAAQQALKEAEAAKKREAAEAAQAAAIAAAAAAALQAAQAQKEKEEAEAAEARQAEEDALRAAMEAKLMEEDAEAAVIAAREAEAAQKNAVTAAARAKLAGKRPLNCEIFVYTRFVNKSLWAEVADHLRPVACYVESDLPVLLRQLRDGTILCALLSRGAVNRSDENSLDTRAVHQPPAGQELPEIECEANLRLAFQTAIALGIELNGLSMPHVLYRESMGAGAMSIQTFSEACAKFLNDLILRRICSQPDRENVEAWFNHARESSGDVTWLPVYVTLMRELYSADPNAGVVPTVMEAEESYTHATPEMLDLRAAELVVTMAAAAGVPLLLTADDLLWLDNLPADREDKGPDDANVRPRLRAAWHAAVWARQSELTPNAPFMSSRMEKRADQGVGLKGTDEERMEAFTLWLNSQNLKCFLDNKGRPMEEVNEAKVLKIPTVGSLYHALSDGIVLLTMIERLQPGLVPWNRVHLPRLADEGDPIDEHTPADYIPLSRFHKVSNCNLVIDCIKQIKGFAVTNMGGTDILDASPKMLTSILGQMQMLDMQRHIIAESEKAAGKMLPQQRGLLAGKTQKEFTEGLIEWANGCAQSLHRPDLCIKSLKDSSLRNSLLVLYIVHSISPIMVPWQFVHNPYAVPLPTQEDVGGAAKEAVAANAANKPTLNDVLALQNARLALACARKLAGVSDIFCTPKELTAHPVRDYAHMTIIGALRAAGAVADWTHV